MHRASSLKLSQFTGREIVVVLKCVGGGGGRAWIQGERDRECERQIDKEGNWKKNMYS